MEKSFALQSPFEPSGDQVHAIPKLVEGIKVGMAFQTLLGVTGSGKTFTMAQVIQATNRPAIIMAPNKTLAAQLYGEFKAFFPDNAVEYFVSYYDYYQPEAYVPSSDMFIEKDAAINSHIEQMRLSATKALLERRDVIIVATVSAIYGLGDPKAYHSMVLHLREGTKLDQRALLQKLTELQYQRNDTVLERGTFRVRGEVVDVFPAESEKLAIRVELFDEDIERISEFDPLTGEVQQTLTRTTIYPKTHYVTPRERLLATVDEIKIELRARLEELRSLDKLVEAQRLDQRTMYDIEMILELGYCSGIENYSRYLSGQKAGEPPPTLLDYLPQGSIMMLDESHVTVPQVSGMYRGDRSRKENLVNYGFRLPSALDNRPLKFEEFEDRMPQVIFVSATPSTYEDDHTAQVVEQVVRPTGLLDPPVEVRAVDTQVDDLLSEANQCVKLGQRILVTTLTKRMAEDLTDYLHEHGMKVRYMHSDIDTVERMEIIRDLRKGVFDVLVGINLLREGLDIPEVALVAILDADKEGFLRSERSLIQTMGRAARHVDGRVILYAAKITNSMARAMAETERRREKQLAHNQAHGIEPKSVSKAILDVMDTGQNSDLKPKSEMNQSTWRDKYMDHTPQKMMKEVNKLEKSMYQYAEDLNFEKAAQLRDEVLWLKENIVSGGAG